MAFGCFWMFLVAQSMLYCVALEYVLNGAGIVARSVTLAAVWVPVSALTVPFLNPLPANAPEKAVGQSSNPWVLAAREQVLSESPLLAWPGSAFEAIWEARQWVEDLSLSTSLTQLFKEIDKNL